MKFLKNWAWCQLSVILLGIKYMVISPLVLPFVPQGGVRAAGRAFTFFIFVNVRHERPFLRRIVYHEFRHVWQWQHHPMIYFRWMAHGINVPYHDRGFEKDARAFAKSLGKHGDLKAFYHIPK